MEFKYLSKDISLKLDLNKCNGCGMCVQVCPRTVLIMNSKKVQIEKKDFCIECGACMMNCAVDAITVNAGTGCAEALIKSIFKIKNKNGSVGCNCG